MRIFWQLKKCDSPFSMSSLIDCLLLINLLLLYLILILLFKGISTPEEKLVVEESVTIVRQVREVTNCLLNIRENAYLFE